VYRDVCPTNKKKEKGQKVRSRWTVLCTRTLPEVEAKKLPY
jgi:hypothetical protein